MWVEFVLQALHAFSYTATFVAVLQHLKKTLPSDEYAQGQMPVYDEPLAPYCRDWARYYVVRFSRNSDRGAIWQCSHSRVSA